MKESRPGENSGRDFLKSASTVGGTDDLIVEAGGEQVHPAIYHAEEQENAQGDPNQQRPVEHIKQHQQLGEQGERKRGMNPGGEHGQEEDRQHLAVEGCGGSLAAAAHLPQGEKPGLTS